MQSQSRLLRRCFVAATVSGAALLVFIMLSAAPARAQNWQKMPLLSAEAAKAGVSPGGEGCQWPRGPVVIAPTDPNFMLLPIDVGGLYRSLDGGKNWQQALVGWNARGANGFAIDPRNPARVLGVAGNSLDWNADWGPSPHGIYLSTNKAASWKHTAALLDGEGISVAYDPSSFDKAKGCCTVAYVASSLAGLLRTDDGGETWKVVSDLPQGLNPDKKTPPYLRVTPTGGVYLGGATGLFGSDDGGKTFTKQRDGEVRGIALSPAAPGSLWVSGSDGLFISSDSGKTFSKLAAVGVEANGKPVRDITVSPADAKHMTCWVQGDNWQWVRYSSSDGGATFAPVKIEKGLSPVPFNVRQGWFAFHPTNPNIVWGLGGDWVTKSTDGGKTFTWANNGYNGVMLGGLFNFNSRTPNTVFLAFQDYNGAFTTDGGKTWNYRDVSGKGWGGYCYGGYAVDENVMYCGDAEGWGSPRRLRLSRDGGKTWAFVNGADGKPLEWTGADVSFSDPTDGNVLFAGPYRSGDKGITWARMDGCDGVYTASPTTNALFGKKGDALVRSTDKGASWSKVADVEGGLSDIACDHRTGRIYVASQDKLKCWEKGTWRSIETPRDQFNNSRVSTVAVDPKQPSVIYVGGPRNTYASHATVCRSTDGGVTWTNLTGNKPLGANVTDGPHEVAAIRVHPVTREAWVNGQCFGMWKIAPPTPGAKGVSAQNASAPRALNPAPPAPVTPRVQANRGAGYP